MNEREIRWNRIMSMACALSQCDYVNVVFARGATQDEIRNTDWTEKCWILSETMTWEDICFAQG